MLARILGQTLDTVCYTKLRGWFENLTETFLSPLISFLK